VGALAAAPIATGPDAGDTLLYVGLGEANASADTMVPTEGNTQFYGDGIIQLVINTSASVPQVVSDTLETGGPTNPFERTAIAKIVVDQSDPNIVYAAVPTAKNGLTGNEGIWASSDGGATWTNTTANARLPSNVMYSDLVMDPGTDSLPMDQQVLYAAIAEQVGSTANGIYMTADGGASWTQLVGQASPDNVPSGIGVGRITLAISNETSGPNELYAAVMTNPLTQTATITGASESLTTVTVDYSTASFQGAQPFTMGQGVQILGLGDGYDTKVAAILTTGTVKPGTDFFTYTADQSGLPTVTMPAPNATASATMGGLYQLGYITVTGNINTDPVAAWNVINGPAGSPNFNLPAVGTDLDYVSGDDGDQGYYDTALAVDPNNAFHIYAAGQDSFLSIENTTSSSTIVTDLEDASKYGQIHVDHHAIDLDMTGSSTYEVLDGSDGGVFKFDSNTTTGTWADLNAGPTASTSLAISQFYSILANPSATSGLLQILGGVQNNGSLQSLNGGQTWSDLHYTNSDGTPDRTGGDGGQVYTGPSGSPGYLINTGSLNSSTDPFSATPGFTRPDTGSSNPEPDNGTTGLFPSEDYLMSPSNPDMLFLGTNLLYMTIDGGKNWYPISSFDASGQGVNRWLNDQATVVNGFPVDNTVVDSIAQPAQAADSNMLYVAGRGGHFLTTVDLPTNPDNPPADDPTWVESDPVTLYSTNIASSSSGLALPQGSITVDDATGFPTSGTLYIQSPNNGPAVVITYTGISGNTFTGCQWAGGLPFTLSTGDTVTFQNDLKYSDIVVDPDNPDSVYVSAANFGEITGGGHVWQGTTNPSTGVVTWTNISTGLPDLPVWSLQVQDRAPGLAPILYAGTDVGVYVSINGGASWSPFGSGLPNVQVRAMDLNLNSSDPAQNVLLVGTFGRSAFEITPFDAGNASLSGTVFVDGARTGTLVPGDFLIPGATVTLTGTTTVNSTPIDSTVSTDANGNFEFDAMFSGTYILTAAPPAIFLDGQAIPGTLGGTPGDNIVAAIDVAAGADGSGYLFPEGGLIGSVVSKKFFLANPPPFVLPPGSGTADGDPSGFVFLDVHGTGVRTPDDPGIAGVPVTLTGTTAQGRKIVETTLTNAISSPIWLPARMW